MTAKPLTNEEPYSLEELKLLEAAIETMESFAPVRAIGGRLLATIRRRDELIRRFRNAYMTQAQYELLLKLSSDERDKEILAIVETGDE